MEVNPAPRPPPIVMSPQIGKMLLLAGALLAALGLLLILAPRLPFRLGHLPGDIVIRGKHSTFYFPLATCLLLSLAFSLLSWLFRRR